MEREPSERLSVVVHSRRLDGPDVVVLDLRRPDGGALPPAAPGAHLDVHLPGGLIRQYSLAGDSADRNRYVLGVLRAPDSRGGSAAVHAHLHEGAGLEVSPPRDAFPLVDRGGRALLLAGGIGITPLLAMARLLAAEGRPFELHYSVRERARLAFLPDLDALGASVHLHVDGEGAPLDLAGLAHGRGARDDVYVCGPPGFIDGTTETLIRLGWPAGAVHTERFTREQPGREGSFTVEAKRSGVRCAVREGQSIAQALAEAGVPVSLSCESGVCGTCLTPVVAGVPEHRDDYQTDAEKAANSMVTICCSGSRTDLLVLDL
ncbi:vanillate O-demethylase ferredoxin subunit [Actinocorallia herbida]|uniref:Vanillate O-demethylase ferredoxin subunit n=1 Tax=Actinocorallia herbida TaxID=58109 RepID=A0A3N1CUW3_9ACTN|nr:vanillate O-demethylase ferredoxin subunit [Actinocorallia herbida]